MRNEYNEYVCFSQFMSQNQYFGSRFSLTVYKYDCQHVFDWTKIHKHLKIIEFVNLGNSFLYFVNLQLGLGQAQQHSGKNDHVGVHRGGSPSKQRRKDRREADREAKAVAEQVPAARNVDSDKNNAAEQADLERTSLVTEEVTINGNEIPQVDGVNDDGEVVASEDIEY